MTPKDIIILQLKEFFIRSSRNQLYTNRRRLESHLSYMFGETDLKGKNVLDVGGGSGLLSLYAAASGANAICLEPEFDGSTQNITDKFDALSSELNLSIGSAILVKSTLQDFESEIKYDVIILANSINHLDEESTITLNSDCESKIKFLELFYKMHSMLAPDGILIITDCDRKNFFNDLGLKSPFMPTIEWNKHQSPTCWVNIAKEAGFKKPIIKWSSPNSLGKIGQFLLGNRLIAYFLFSHFRIELIK